MSSYCVGKNTLWDREFCNPVSGARNTCVPIIIEMGASLFSILHENGRIVQAFGSGSCCSAGRAKIDWGVLD